MPCDDHDNFYVKLFRGEVDWRDYSKRNVKPRRRMQQRDIENDGEGEHEPIGREEKRFIAAKEATKMDTLQTFTKAIANLGEHAYTEIIQKFASNNKLPNETAAQAFTRVFTEDSEQGQAIRKFWLVAKGKVVAADGAEREYGSRASRGYASRALDDDEADDEGRGVVADALDDEWFTWSPMADSVRAALADRRTSSYPTVPPNDRSMKSPAASIKASQLIHSAV